MTGLTTVEASSDAPTAIAGESATRKGGFRGAVSRSKSVRVSHTPRTSDGADAKQDNLPRSMSRGLSRGKSLREKLSKGKDAAVMGSRARTGATTLKAKRNALAKYPALVVQEFVPGRSAFNLVIQGANSIRAEVIDLNAMVQVMQESKTMLTHSAVERFFSWIPLFALYMERYLLVEEDLLLRWVEEREGKLKGALRPSARMVLRGKIQKGMTDVQAVQDKFTRQLPAGERIGQLVEAVHAFTSYMSEYLTTSVEELPKVIAAHFSNSEVEKNKIRIVKHVVGLVGSEDFVAIYTRWMHPADLLQWKTKVLLPCDFKYFAYKTWEKDMDFAHYQLAAHFAEDLEEENREEIEAAKVSKADAMYARQVAQTRIATQEEEEISGAEFVEEEEDGGESDDRN